MSANKIASGEITPEDVYLNRRTLMKAGAAAVSIALTGLAYRRLNSVGKPVIATDAISGFTPVSADSIGKGFDLTETKTPYDRVAGYNNFYEFTTDKEGVASQARGFVSKPWQVSVGGLVHEPKIFDIDDLLTTLPLEERVYRMRCVEAWSMVIPWVGFQLSHLLAKVRPMSSAKYVAFETLLDPEKFPGQRRAALDWPYVEGLRLDEANHPLTIMAVGLYGRVLPGQNGAPLRLVVPWKYGFKGIKSISKITLTETPPPCTWNLSAPFEYGFYANVNPEVPHPRWSQATEDRLGEGRRPTLPFNGYAEQVADLYQGMDLRVNY